MIKAHDLKFAVGKDDRYAIVCMNNSQTVMVIDDEQTIGILYPGKAMCTWDTPNAARAAAIELLKYVVGLKHAAVVSADLTYANYVRKMFNEEKTLHSV